MAGDLNVLFLLQSSAHLKPILAADREEREFQCQFCSARFDRILSLYGHLSSHKNVEFPCQVAECKQTLSSLKAFRKHFAEHSGNSHPHQCKKCGLKFDRRSQLKYHMDKIHENVVNFFCSQCDKGFFRKSDLKTHEDSHSGVKKFVCECGKSFSHVSNFNRHKRIHTKEKPYVCQVCGKRFNQANTLNSHTKAHTANIFAQCPDCPKKFKTGRIFLKHLQTEHKYSEDNVKKVTANSVLFSHKQYLKLVMPDEGQNDKFSKSFYCNLCGAKFGAKFKLRQHISQDHGQKDRQPRENNAETLPSLTEAPKSQVNESASYMFNEVEPAGSNMLEVTDDETALPVELERYKVETPAVSSQSMTNAASIDPELRNVEETSAAAQQIIIVQNPSESLWDDQDFEKTTTTIEIVLEDNSVVKADELINFLPANTQSFGVQTESIGKENDTGYLCDICLKRFSKKSNLKSHRGIHQSSERLHKCDHCGEAFAWRSSLNRHIEKLHTENITIYACKWCDKSYKVKSILNDHIKRDHLQERRHQCDQCNKTFFKAADLSYHKRLHDSVRPYSCGVCSRSFSHLSHYHRHARLHTGVKPYCCDICPYRSVQPGSLKIHKQNRHPQS